MRKILENLKDTKQFAEEFLSEVRTQHPRVKSPASYQDDKAVRNVILLQGELGAGKTTFSQFLLEAIGAEGSFTSPTFVIMKKYELRGPASQLKDVYHLDCYRVDEEGVLDLGWEEIIADKNNLILVEWPERIKKIWPKNYWLLKFKYVENVKNGRIVEINVI